MSKTGKRILTLVLVLLLAAMAAAGAWFGWRFWEEQQYQNALSAAETLYTAGNYEAAGEAFAALGLEERVRDCDAQLLQMANENAYAAAEALLTAGDFLGAKDAFLALGDFGR